MKTRESGMPDESVWSGFFPPEEVLQKLGLQPDCGDVVDFGCGYGTFAIPAARMVRGTVHALDIEPEMVAATKAKAEANLRNVRVTTAISSPKAAACPTAASATRCCSISCTASSRLDC